MLATAVYLFICAWVLIMIAIVLFVFCANSLGKLSDKHHKVDTDEKSRP